jgi:hypothetical protein
MAINLKPKSFINNIVEEAKSLPVKDLKEILDFVYFVKAKAVTEPSQAYFWTKLWQKQEAGADVDKRLGRVIGSGAVKDLLKELKRAR